MAKLVMRCNYFKNEPAKHKSNFMKYLGTREGVEMDPAEVPKAFWEDIDMHGKKSNYVEYLADRPGAVHVEGQVHGLFSDEGMKINLENAMEEVSTHPGTVWINVISLRREDAARLGYDKLEKWQALLRSHVADVAKAFKIKQGNLKWYAAFHNEGHHPHLHLVVFSKGSDGYLSKHGVEELKSVYTREIFKDELANLYDEKTKQRQSVKDAAGEKLLKALEKMAKASGEDPEVISKMTVLSKRLQGIKGKKVYGYLHRDVKEMVDEVFREMEKIPEVKDCYEKWMKWQRAIVGYYQDGEISLPPLSENPEFKSIKNMIIREAVAMQKKNHEPDAELEKKLKDTENHEHLTCGKSRDANGKSRTTHGKSNERPSLIEDSWQGNTGIEAEWHYAEDAHRGNEVNGRKRDNCGGNLGMVSGAGKAGLTVRLLKDLENLLQEKIRKTQGGRKMISEWKNRKQELARKAALGLKSDEGPEDITQTL